MKMFLGRFVSYIGAHLWQNGGWTGDETYDELKVSGKIGYRLFMIGCDLMGLTIDDLKNISENSLY